MENKFKAKVSVGTNGSSDEHEFDPAVTGLTAPVITNENAGFLRSDANLAVVIVSDEVEHSPLAVTYYYNTLMNVKGFKRANMFSVNAIVGLGNGTGGACFSEQDDGRYSQMVALTNGVKEEICNANWSKALEQLGKTAFGFRTNFFLNAVPDLTGGKVIKVQIDGVDVPATDIRGATVWTYDPVANSVNFEPMFVPEPGQTLTITYFVTCF